MSRLLLARHGNTFGPGDKVVWVGAQEDLPLVASGEAQATALGEALRDSGVKLARLICGPLLRTRRAAEIVATITGFGGTIEIDDRLREIDYGSWGGRSNEEIEQEFGADALAEWDQHHRRPKGVDWSPEESVIRANALAAMADAIMEDRPTLLITSNGVLRYIYGALEGEPASAKVKTGNVCAVRLNGDRGQRLFWNEKPNADLIAQALS
jgi:broad specificity phosphatase PhoE